MSDKYTVRDMKFWRGVPGRPETETRAVVLRDGAHWCDAPDDPDERAALLDALNRGDEALTREWAGWFNPKRTS